LGKLAVVDLRRPQPVDVEIGGIGDAVLVLHEPVVHLLDEEGIVAEIADPPFGVAHGLAVASGKIAVPLQAERRVQIEVVPSLLDGTVIFEIVDIEADVIDDVVAGISAIGSTVLRAPARAPVVFETDRMPPEYLDDASERLDVIGLMIPGEPGHGAQIHLPTETNDGPWLRFGDRGSGCLE